MRITLPHNTTKDEAKKILDQTTFENATKDRVPGNITLGDFEKKWDGNTLTVWLTVSVHSIIGKRVRGTIEVDDKNLTVNFRLPVLVAVAIGQEFIKKEIIDLVLDLFAGVSDS